MILHFPTFFSSLVFLASLELAFFANDRMGLITLWICASAIFASWKADKRFSSAIIPTVFAISAIMMFFLIDSALQRQWFAFLSFGIYYLALLGIYRLRCYREDRTARGMLAFSGMSAFFLFVSGFYGIYLNFAIPIAALMVSYGVITFLLSYQYLSAPGFEEHVGKKSFLFSLILALVLAELAWMMSFLPFGYLTTGYLALSFYYILWDLIQSYFIDDLSRKRLFLNIALSGILSGMVLFSARWLPMV